MTAIVFYFQVHQPFRVRKDLSPPPIPLETLAEAAAANAPAETETPSGTRPTTKTRTSSAEQAKPRRRSSKEGAAEASPPASLARSPRRPGRSGRAPQLAKEDPAPRETPPARDPLAELEAMMDTGLDEYVLRRVAERCYLPMNERLRKVIEESEGRFRCAFSLSGTAIDQMERWCPEALASFQALAETGAVEFLGETSHHSLCGLEDEQEFRDQVRSHRERIERLFGRRPTTFRNTELILDPRILGVVEEEGFDTILAEGAPALLRGRSPHRLYRLDGTRELLVLPRDWGLSDDIAFRFSNPEWEGHPLFADVFAADLGAVPPPNEALGLFMDYETFGEHQPADTGILDFMEHLPRFVMEDSRCFFLTPAELRHELPAADVVRVDRPISWADEERDISAWLGNPMQRDAHQALYRLLPDCRALAAEGRPQLLDLWRRLSTSDHVYYMSTKRMSDGDVHSYFSPFDSPFASYAQFTHVLRHLRTAIREARRDAPRTDAT